MYDFLNITDENSYFYAVFRIVVRIRQRGCMGMSNVGETIKALRLERGMTQAELGRLLGVTKATVQKYEGGSILNLKSKTVKKLAHIFEVHPIELMGWDAQFDSAELSAQAYTIEQKQAQFIKIISSTVVILNSDGLEKILDYAEIIATMPEFTIRE